MSTDQDLGTGGVKEVDPINIDNTNPDAAPASGDDNKSSDLSQTVDYKAELEKAQKQLGQAEHVIQNLKKDKKEGDSSTPDDMAETMRKVVQEVLQQEKLAESEHKKTSLLSSIQNEDERALVKFHLDNTIRATGNAEADFHTARAIANAAKLQQENSEWKRSQTTETTNDSVGSGKRDNTPSKEEDYSRHFTQEQLARFKQSGINPKDVLEKAKNLEGKHFVETTMEAHQQSNS